jgi:hypothetical protein
MSRDALRAQKMARTVTRFVSRIVHQAQNRRAWPARQCSSSPRRPFVGILSGMRCQAFVGILSGMRCQAFVGILSACRRQLVGLLFTSVDNISRQGAPTTP